MKTAKGICNKCGEVEISGTWTDAGEEMLMVPTVLAPTIQALGKIYKEQIGGTYRYNTGNKMSDDFEKKYKSLSHKSVDEDDCEEHMMQPLEVWNLII